MKQFYKIILSLSLFLISSMQPSEAPLQQTDLVIRLESLYNLYNDEYVHHLPASMQNCRQALLNEKISLESQIKALSYKNIFFSLYGFLKTALLTGSIVGIGAIGTLFSQYGVIKTTLLTIGLAGLSLVSVAFNIPLLHHHITETYFTARQYTKTSSEDTNNLQNIHHVSANDIRAARKYLCAVQILTATTIISFASLYNDTTPIRTKKGYLTAELNTINTMLELLH